MADFSAHAQALLRRCGAELDNALKQLGGTIRHAFFAVGGSSVPVVMKSDIDATVGLWLGADKYDSLLMGPARYPLSADAKAELWYVFMANRNVSDKEARRWESTLTNLNNLARDGAFHQTFPGVAASDGWLPWLYRLAMRHPEFGIGDLRGASLPESGGKLPAPLLSDPDFFERWLTGKSALPAGDQFLLFFGDIRTCSLRALWRAESPIMLQFDSGISDGVSGPKSGQAVQPAESVDDSPSAMQPKRNTGGGEANERDEKLAALQPAERKAYFAFLAAEAQVGGRLEDREAYDRLQEHGLPDNAGDLGALADYSLPAFDTWSRQLRAARNAVGEQKYTRRAGRPSGGSIIKSNKLERRS